ncbi:NUDIX hydrolase [Vibrio nigripulchritudo]|uniref:NUDIX hydrolase n=1 Tax=Vibrio nigripulchritudo TaxID=28173 RepID=UPI00249278FE|nr:NUDIX domain-containing protein [Vibrio nigripulchritudo]BDU37232.1 DNA mismatch repair protein MutT [Vibrio nigripulchritudo]BDU42952.1 DNA mismatch repair protein MutT [Vibrio nigripulchritudo]
MKKLESVAWVLARDSKVLCVKTKGKDKYFIPGGKLEPGESHEAGLIREIKEELCVDLDPATIKRAFSVCDVAYEFEDTTLEMHCYYADFMGEISTNSEIESMDWLDHSQLDLCAPAAQKAILKVL